MSNRLTVCHKIPSTKIQGNHNFVSIFSMTAEGRCDMGMPTRMEFIEIQNAYANWARVLNIK